MSHIACFEAVESLDSGQLGTASPISDGWIIPSAYTVPYDCGS